MKIAENLLSYENISNEEALKFCRENALTPFPFLAIEISIHEDLKPIHILSSYKKNPFLLITLFHNNFSFDYIPYYGYVPYNAIKKWHRNKSTYKQILIDENIKFILEAAKEKDRKFVICTEPDESDFRGIDWALKYNNSKVKISKDNFYTAILDLKSELTLKDWININFASAQRGGYKQAIRMSYEIKSINFLPDNIKDIYIEMFNSQKIIIQEKLLERFIFILEKYIRIKNGIGNFLLFEKLNQDKNIVGYDFFIIFKKSCYYLFGVNVPRFKKTSKPAFCWAEYRKFFISKGIYRVDFIGVNSPYRGRFKTSLGGKVIPCWYFATEKK